MAELSDVVACRGQNLGQNLATDYPAGLPHRYGSLIMSLIEQMRIDISASGADRTNDRQSSTLRQDLDAVSTHTASATHAILDACETMGPLMANLDQPSFGQMQAARERIYEACGFQDLVGQRISRMVTTLQNIDRALAAVLAAFGGSDGSISEGVGILADMELNQICHISGPQLPDLAIRQNDVDQLLAGD
jgi:chemotaxis protein CheZ